MSKKRGRPSDYSDALAKEVCDWISSGKSLKKFCAQDGQPTFQTVFRWIAQNKEFRDQYDEACKVRREHRHEEIIEIADESNPSTYLRDKLRIDARKWDIERMTSKRPEETANQPVHLHFYSTPKPERYNKPGDKAENE